jgi:hypothetical protein
MASARSAARASLQPKASMAFGQQHRPAKPRACSWLERRCRSAGGDVSSLTLELIGDDEQHPGRVFIS